MASPDRCGPEEEASPTADKPPLKAGVYVRVSTEMQDPENQLAQLTSLCAARSWEIYKVYQDVERGGDPARVQLNELMHDARSGRIQIVVFWAWDRLTRGGVKAAFELMENLRLWKVHWESLQEPFLSSPADSDSSELLLSIMAWIARQESRRISQRTKAGMAKRKALGLPVGRHPKGCMCPKHRRQRAKIAEEETTPIEKNQAPQKGVPPATLGGETG